MGRRPATPDPMHRSLLVRQVGPAALLFVGLILAAIVLDAALHRAGLGWIGLYLGPVGVATLVLSFVYSLRKRKLITSGQPKQLLEFHQTLGWLGSLMLLLHGGSHFNSLLPWLALLAMLVVAASGITGGVLLRRALELVRASDKAQPDSARLLLNAVTVDLMKRWRAVHMPLNAVFLTLATIHVVAVLLL